MTSEAIDVGTGYTRKASTYNAALTEVGRGKPMGELLRRYWLPVGLLADAEGEVGIGPAELGGLVAAGVVAHRTRSQVWILLAGMAVYWLARALL